MQNKTIAQFDFLKKGKYLLTIFLLFILVGMGFIFTSGIKLGVDFAGGKQLRISFDNKTNMDQNSLQRFFKKLDIEATITSITNSEEKEFFVYYPSEKDDTKSKLLKKSLQSQFHSQWSIKTESFVGPKIGKQFKKIAVYSTIITLILLLFYIGLRFQFRFGVAAIIALLHDVLFVLAFIKFSNTSFDIPILAALLTIIGYSLNDTIVIFDRLRYETSLFKGTMNLKNYKSIINNSIALSLSRTILTATTTLGVLIILFFIGGAELKPMSLVLIVGVVVGTFSSNIVAPPVLYLWYSLKGSGTVQKNTSSK